MSDRWVELRYVIEGMMPAYPYTGAEVRRGVLLDVLAAMDRIGEDSTLNSEKIALEAGTHEPAVDDFGHQYLARVAEPTWVHTAANDPAGLYDDAFTTKESSNAK